MKRISCLMLIVIVVLGLVGCAGKTKVEQPAAQGVDPLLAGLPESVVNQSRKGATESDTWQQFDQSGQVKFLQVQTTAPASDAGTGEKLDGSVGEYLVEISVDPALGTDTVMWSLKNNGPSMVWVLAVSKSNSAVPIPIEADGTAEMQSELEDGYCYIVVDNEGGQETTLQIEAKSGETDAKTARGKAMAILWF